MLALRLGFAALAGVLATLHGVSANGDRSVEVVSASTTFGAVSGNVRVPNGAMRRDARLSPYSRQAYGPSRYQASSFSVEDVVVYVTTVSGRGSAASSPVIVDQVDLKIVQRVTPIPVGTSVNFPNSDDVFHNLFSLSEPKKFNLGRYAPGETRSVVFDRPGIVRLFCDIHSDMGGAILVLDSDRFARPSADGFFTIDGLEPGRHQIVAWHDALGADTTEILVREGEVAQVVLTLQ